MSTYAPPSDYVDRYRFLSQPEKVRIPLTKDIGFPCFQTLYVFETKPYMFITGGDVNNENVVILVVNRMVSQLKMKYDNNGYVYANIHEARNRIQSICLSMNVKLEKIYPISAIIGLIPLPKLYFVFATKVKYAGSIFGRPVYSVIDVAVVGVQHGVFESSRHPSNDRYRDMLRSFDFSRDFYFSYHYDLTHTVQHNLTQSVSQPSPSSSLDADASPLVPSPCIPNTHIPLRAQPSTFHRRVYNSRFTWNSYLASNFISRFPSRFSTPIDDTNPTKTQLPANSVTIHMARPQQPFPNVALLEQDVIHESGPYSAYRWIPALICGFFSQTRVNVSGKALTWSLLSRRSRYFAGTRYLRRGISKDGNVANEVESELILSSHDLRGASTEDAGPHRAPSVYCGGLFQVASAVLLRGSIPLFWGQELSRNLSPPIRVYSDVDPGLGVSEIHFRDLLRRYGGRVHCINLIKQLAKSQEVTLGAAYLNAARALNARLCQETGLVEGSGLAEVNLMDVRDKPLGSVSSRTVHVDTRKIRTSMPGGYGEESVEVGGGDGSCCNVFKGAQKPKCLADCHVFTKSLLADDDHCDTGVLSVSQNPLFSGPEKPFQEAPTLFPHTAPSMHSYLGSLIAYHVYDFLGRRGEHNVISELKSLCSGIASELGVFSALVGQDAAALSGACATEVAINQQEVGVCRQDLVITSYQRGVARVNCVDCLDRTNVTMFCVAKESFLLMLRAIGLQDERIENVSPCKSLTSRGEYNPSVINVDQQSFAAAVCHMTRLPPQLLLMLQKTFSEHGDRIAIQYAGSGAMHKETILIDEDAHFMAAAGDTNATQRVSKHSDSALEDQEMPPTDLLSPGDMYQPEDSPDQLTTHDTHLSAAIQEPTLKLTMSTEIPVEVLTTTCDSFAQEVRRLRIQQSRSIRGAKQGISSPTISPSPSLDSASPSLPRDTLDVDGLTLETSADTPLTDSEITQSIGTPTLSAASTVDTKDIVSEKTSTRGMFSSFGLKNMFSKLTGKEEKPKEETSFKDDETKEKESILSKMSGLAVNGFTAVKRYYKNNITDLQKQQTISLITGDFIPHPKDVRPPLWDLEPTYHSTDFKHAAITTECVSYTAPFNVSDYTFLMPVISKFLHGLHNPRLYKRPVVNPMVPLMACQSPLERNSAPESNGDNNSVIMTSATANTKSAESEASSIDLFAILGDVKPSVENITIEHK